MNTAAFLAELPRRFASFPASEVPLDRSLEPLLATTEGLSMENNLALIAIAAEHLAAGEAYVEAGTFHGRTVIAAATTGADCIAIDNFSFEGGERHHIEANLERFGVADRVAIREGDTLDVLAAGGFPPIGVFYYDADHSTEATVAALDAVRPHLAPAALIVIDDADWEKVRAAREQWVAANPEATLALVIPGREHDQPWWWAGMDVIAWHA